MAGNISYVFTLAYSLIAQEDKRRAADGLMALAAAYASEPRIPEYCARWAADCYVVVADFASALDVFAQVNIHATAGFQTDQLLFIKANLKAPLAGRDVLTLFGAKVTTFALTRLDVIARYLDIQLAEVAKREGDILQHWIQLPSVPRHPYGAFSGVPLQTFTPGPRAYGFSRSPEVERQCAELTRDAENTLREDEGIPRVGEGWVAETKLYYDLKTAFPSLEVVHHARTEWLGYQHLDIFFPSLLIAFEYQGAQHDAPVDYFGGEEAFKRQRQRDARKRSLCLKHNVQLIEVREGYLLEDLLTSVRRHF